MTPPTANDKAEFAKGLEGIIAGETSLSLVDGKNSQLYYRGISIEQFVGKSSFEEVVFLLWNLRLPRREELDRFKNELAIHREIPFA